MKMLGHISAKTKESEAMIPKSEWTMDCPGIKYTPDLSDSSSDEVSPISSFRKMKLTNSFNI